MTLFATTGLLAVASSSGSPRVEPIRLQGAGHLSNDLHSQSFLRVYMRDRGAAEFGAAGFRASTLI